MRTNILCLLVIVLFLHMLGGCANKEVVKTEEPIVPAIVAAPEAPPPSSPEQKPQSLPAPQPQPSPPPVAVKAEAQEEQKIIPASQQNTASTETEQKNILEMIYFDFDKFDLREADRDILTRNAQVILDKLKGNITIEGHCDERGSSEYNLALGERRARSAMKYLVTLGVPAERLSIISYGEEKPIDTGHDEAAWAKNRRSQFVEIDK